MPSDCNTAIFRSFLRTLLSVLTLFPENGPLRCVDGVAEVEGKPKGKHLPEGPGSTGIREASHRCRGSPGSTAQSGIKAQTCPLTAGLALVLRARPLSLFRIVQCMTDSPEAGEVPPGHRWTDRVPIPLRTLGEKKNLRENSEKAHSSPCPWYLMLWAHSVV